MTKRDDQKLPERVLSDEACRLTGLPERTLLSLAIRGQIPSAAKLGRRWTFNREKLVAWIADREAETMRRAQHAAEPWPKMDWRPTGSGRGNPLADAIERRFERAMRPRS